MTTFYTNQEVKQEFINTLRSQIEYWDSIEDYSCKEKMSGLIFSVLALIDGVSASFPGIDLVISDSYENVKWRIDNEEDFYMPGMVINDGVMLHEEWYKDDERSPK